MDTERRGQQRSTPRPGIMDGGTWTPRALQPSAELSGRRGKVEERGLCLGPRGRPGGGRAQLGASLGSAAQGCTCGSTAWQQWNGLPTRGAPQTWPHMNNDKFRLQPGPDGPFQQRHPSVGAGSPEGWEGHPVNLDGGSDGSELQLPPAQNPKGNASQRQFKDKVV